MQPAGMNSAVAPAIVNIVPSTHGELKLLADGKEEAADTNSPSIPAFQSLRPPSLNASNAVKARTDEGDEFLDASNLSVRPTPLHDIELPPPVMGSRVGAAKMAMTLFIDERGQVVRVRVDESDMTGRMTADVQRTFANAPFAAGMLDGRPVKAKLRIEVRIEPMPLESAPAASVGGAASQGGS